MVSFWHTVRKQKSKLGFIVADERTKEARAEDRVCFFCVAVIEFSRQVPEEDSQRPFQVRDDHVAPR
jgi:hypothetical protein